MLVYQLLPSRYGMNPDDLRRADAIEVVVGQGAKPGGGGMLLGHKISDRVAAMRDLPKGIDQRSACRHPDWTGPDDLEIKIGELREITDWQKPIFVKVGATRTYYDVQLAVKAGADVIVVDGMQGGTAATQDVFIEHVGIPTLCAIPLAVQALQELGLHREVQLIVSGGIRSGADVAKALALGADAVSIGTAALIAMGDNSPDYEAEYRKIGSSAGYYDDWQAGRDPTGISTQDDELAARFDPELGGRRIANYLRVLTLETQTLARACGKSHVHNLEPEDLVALTIEAAAMARVPLAGTNWIPGLTGSRCNERGRDFPRPLSLLSNLARVYQGPMYDPSAPERRIATTITMQTSERISMNGATRLSFVCSGGNSICLSAIVAPTRSSGSWVRHAGEHAFLLEAGVLLVHPPGLLSHPADQRREHEDDAERGHDVGAGRVRPAEGPEVGDRRGPRRHTEMRRTSFASSPSSRRRRPRRLAVGRPVVCVDQDRDAHLRSRRRG